MRKIVTAFNRGNIKIVNDGGKYKATVDLTHSNNCCAPYHLQIITVIFLIIIELSRAATYSITRQQW